ncbi:pre-mRNA-processing factor 39-2-like isoform X1 [Musa acuminata AAA Group]|uniref:pre-mRNA-processing factor 39-2 isoform X1 n=1 Tax=Musa acuminata AAA Group TaxID=214697 RepID=UPI0031DFF66A
MEASDVKEIEERDTLMEDGAQESSEMVSVGYDWNNFQALLGDIPNDFESWTSLIAHIEKAYPNDLERICLVYDAFLSEYPLCYGYWNKYASNRARLCTLHEVEEIYERAVQAIPYSVNLWVSYCTFGALSFEDPADVRRLYERALSFVKKDYLCYQLWDKYIEFEYSLKQWSQLAHLYIRTLVFPTKKLQSYYERFKRLIDMWSKEMGCQHDLDFPRENTHSHGLIDIKDSEYVEISNLIREFMDQKASKYAFKKFLSIGQQLYQRSRQIDEKISCFEAHIRRNYFHVKPLDSGQLENWHHYLDFVETQGDFDWIVKLYERCLIACANYSEFWIRYVEFVEAKGGRELANHALTRAVTVFLKKVPAFCIYSAMFKEKIGDVSGARALFLQRDMDLASNLVETVYREANMEKRMGNTDVAYLIYEKAIELAKEKGNLKIIPNLYTNFARFTFVTSGSFEAARGVFIKGIQQLPCKSILEGLIHFATIHGGASEIPVLDTIIANVIEPESNVYGALGLQDREDISRSFLEFMDLYGNIHEIRKAWDRHRKLFSHIMRVPLDGTFVEKSSIHKSKDGRKGTVNAVSRSGCFDNSNPALGMHQVKHSPAQYNVDILSERDATSNLHLEIDKNSAKEIQGQDAKLPEQPMMEQSEPHVITNEQVHEAPATAQVTDVPLECSKIENDKPEHDSDDNIRPPSRDNLQMNSPDSDSRQVTLNTLAETELSEQVITVPCGSKVHDGMDTVEASGCDEPDPLDMKLSTSSQADFQKDESHSHQATEPPAIAAELKLQQQQSAQSKSKLKHDLPVSIASPQLDSSGGSWTQMSYGRQAPEEVTSSHQHSQASQPQQGQVPAQIQNPSAGTSSQLLMDQSHPCQSQVWTSTQAQQTNQIQLLYQMAAAQAYQTGNYAWAGQNMQHQGLVYVQPQPSPQPASQAQTLVYQQLHQNSEQYGYSQSGQVFAPHIWHYYQQQLYYLQQQQQQQQQQSSQISQAQQPQESLSQQLSLQTQQLLLQLQQQQYQQLNQQEPQQNISSPTQNQNHQHQPQQKPSHLQQQNEQANQTQEQQQLLYLQQQQQQMYLQQQQQQLLQQQMLQQQQQQAPQQFFQQQQLLQQQQQQLLLLQQQHQQQQLLQVQQLEHQQQQRFDASEIQVQPTSSHLQAEEANLMKVEQATGSQSSTPQRTPTKQ